MEVDVPLVGKVPIGNASNGLCGGMVFTAFDIFTAHRGPPTDPMPAHGTPLFKYIVHRLIDSWDIPEGVLKYFHWMSTPDRDTDMWIAKHRGVAWRTIKDEWPAVKHDLDAGRPCALGLVTVKSSKPKDLSKNHQVLAWGYELDGDQVMVKVYDPNTDRTAGDGVRISMAVGDPTKTAHAAHNINIGHPVRGFFRVDYTASVPPQ